MVSLKWERIRERCRVEDAALRRGCSSAIIRVLPSNVKPCSFTSCCRVNSGRGIACSRRVFKAARPSSRIKVSGSCPSGSMATFPAICSLKNSGTERMAALTPAASPSKSSTHSSANPFSSFSCWMVSAVPNGATTLGQPCTTRETRSKFPSTRIACFLRRISSPC